MKSGFSDNGSAWIGLVSFSKSGKTIYFDGKAFQTLDGTGISGNYFELESGNEYWISGVKKDMSDRHKFGGGIIYVEKRILKDYLETIGKNELPKAGYEMTEVDTEKPIERINELENEKLEPAEFSTDLYFKKPNELTKEEIQFLLIDLEESANSPQYKKTRRSIKSRRIELEMELEKRGIKNVG
ncbi:hypothetical protein [Polaribacter sp. AHE13PA]|uniref:hypothetical protein n=1 Tax=Polaribacter sp. AHE13PA TaxID=2745562 RepID=UPI001C4E74AC|nr:hypothetical protein [Polaribacter sp. AHE13PA]QXP67690.1 hypothetical protein H0I28_04075 [Polaribacter sp. AHE13PA]